jgi:polysaccharide deacetylase 2 family uncharacterized protein YibQ
MKTFNHFQHINLTNDQRNVLEKLHTFLESVERIFILQGYAGSRVASFNPTLQP